MGRYVGARLVRFLGHTVLTVNTPIGRMARSGFISGGTPLIRVKPADLAAAGVERVPRVVGVRDGLPVLEDERVLEVTNVIWCTGFHSGFSWIDLPVFDVHGDPRHERGVVAGQPGLYFLGLEFLFAATSGTLPGVGRDAKFIAGAIAARSAQVPVVHHAA